jgi:hypothetical protein
MEVRQHASQDQRRFHVPGGRRPDHQYGDRAARRLVEGLLLAEVFDRNQATTALTITEPLSDGYSSDDPLVVALREELR